MSFLVRPNSMMIRQLGEEVIVDFIFGNLVDHLGNNLVTDSGDQLVYAEPV